LDGSYPVLFCNGVVGKVTVTRQGLYYFFCCLCRISSDVVCRLQVQCNGQRISLGIVVPEKDGFGLRTRVPVKRIGEGELSFSLVPKHDKGDGKFAPIFPEEPFAYIARLKGAYLAVKDGQPGIYL